MKDHKDTVPQGEYQVEDEELGIFRSRRFAAR